MFLLKNKKRCQTKNSTNSLKIYHNLINYIQGGFDMLKSHLKRMQLMLKKKPHS